jgi:hypothetical protein
MAALSEHDKSLIANTIKGIAPAVFELEQKLNALTARVQELEARPTLNIWALGRKAKPTAPAVSSLTAARFGTLTPRPSVDPVKTQIGAWP